MAELTRVQCDLLDLLQSYVAHDARQAALAVAFGEFIEAYPNCCDRNLPIGHLTASAWLVDSSGRSALLTHHRKLGKWVQLGGHADNDHRLAEVALREAVEESGIVDLILQPGIFDLDRHWIPEHGQDPGHWHYDVRFVVRTTTSEAFVVSEESHDLAWRDIAALSADGDMDASVRRMAEKWLAR